MLFVTGLKPKTRDHYHAHRLSYWNHLIPKLHVPGPLMSPTTSGGIEYHLLTDHENEDSYEGVVRSDSTSNRMRSLFDSHLTESSSINNNINSVKNTSSPTIVSSKDAKNSKVSQPPTTSVKFPSDHLLLSKSASPSSNGHQGDASSPPKSIVNNQTPHSVSMMIQEGLTATSITVVAIGVGLLVLNVIIFVAMFYKKDRTTSLTGSTSSTSSSSGNKASVGTILKHHPHSSINPSGILQVQLFIEDRLRDQKEFLLSKHISYTSSPVTVIPSFCLEMLCSCPVYLVSL